MNKFFKIISSNYLLAFYIFIIGVWVLHPSFDKYEWKVRYRKGKDYIFESFLDINSDGVSEYFKAKQKKNFQWSVSLFDENNILLDETDLDYYLFIHRKSNLIINDFNKNGFPELYFLGVRHDSLSLIRLEYNNDRIEILSVQSFFLDEVKNVNHQYHFRTKLDYADLDNDGSEEIVVLASAGAAIQPRSIYAVDLRTSEVKKSPISGMDIFDFTIADLEGDNKKEILLHTESSCSINEELFGITDSTQKDIAPSVFENRDVLLKYNDCDVWVAVLDGELDYLFSPIPVKGVSGAVCLQQGVYESKPAIYGVYSNIESRALEPVIMVFSPDGIVQLVKSIDEVEKCSAPLCIPKPPLSLEEVVIIDKRAKQFHLTEDWGMALVEDEYIIGNDNNTISTQFGDEKLFVSVSAGDLGLYTQDKELIIDFNIPADTEDNLWVSQRKESDTEDLIMIDSDGLELQVMLSVNPIYAFRYLLWLMYYLIALLLVKALYFLWIKRRINNEENINVLIQERMDAVESQKKELLKLTKKIKKQQEIEHQQKEHLEKRQEELAFLYEQLSSSASYGKDLKGNILPDVTQVNRYFPNNFIFFKPRNLVGGDFYWVESFGTKKLLIVGDAPGEAISAGFLSLVVISLIKSISFTEDMKASDVLKKINVALFKNLSGYLEKKGEGVKMAVLIFDSKKDDKIPIQIASANVPIYAFLPNSFLSMEKIMPNDYAVHSDVSNQVFADVNVQFPEKTMLYIATKGLFLQEGEERKLSFGEERLPVILQRIRVLPTEKQKEILIENFTKWQGILYQTEDVLCVGIKI